MFYISMCFLLEINSDDRNNVCVICQLIHVLFHIIKFLTSKIIEFIVCLRNKSWKPECVLSFNMGWRILVFYPKPEVRDTIYQYPPTHVKTQNTFRLP